MQESKEQSLENDRTTDVALGAAFTISGIALAGVGLIGIDSYEAKTPSDAFMSTDMLTLNIDEQFVTTTDLGFGAVMGGGLLLCVAGISKLLKRSR